MCPELKIALSGRHISASLLKKRDLGRIDLGHSNPIVDDIQKNHRIFLPGDADEQPSADDIVRNMSGSVLFDGLTKTEANLILSTLPKSANRIFIQPLDKGLSNAKVLAGRYETADAGLSLPYVFKLGQTRKIEIEYEAIQKWVRNSLPAVEVPVIRKFDDSALLVQGFVGLTRDSRLKSLKDYIRNGDPSVIDRLLRERLANWYTNQGKTPIASNHLLDDLLKWYLDKAGQDVQYPSSWTDLQTWVKDLTGCEWQDISSAIDQLRNTNISSITCIVHGDLHSQNVLIDDRGECWPIDFYWCHPGASPLVDLAMLECSLKFLAIHQRSDLRCLFEFEKLLALEPEPTLTIRNIPYGPEIRSVFDAVLTSPEVCN